MRRGVLIFLVINLIVIVILIHSVFTLLSLLVEDGAADAIHHADIPAPSSPLMGNRPQLIPKLIHQTYINDSIPEIWKAAQQSCIDLHEDYEYRMWTDEKSRELIVAEYPWFLETFDGYAHPIQRADAIRYFVLAHFGGIYVDLDDGCNRRLDPLLSYPSWLHRTIPTGISNDAMGAIPRHPFFLRVIDSLQAYDRSWGLPYITVMYSTGPLFLSVIWKKYMVSDSNVGDGFDGGRVRVLSQEDYNHHTWSFFTYHKGSSWHGDDARLIFWMGSHWILLTVLGFSIAGLVGSGGWWIYGKIFYPGQRSRPGKRIWNLSRWRSPHKNYMLVDRHEV